MISSRPPSRSRDPPSHLPSSSSGSYPYAPHPAAYPSGLSHPSHIIHPSHPYPQPHAHAHAQAHPHYRAPSSSSTNSHHSHHSHRSHAHPPPGAPGQSYVQALHAFDPASLPSTSAAAAMAGNMYLRFKAGEVIRVWSRDEKGWWDGEITVAAVEEGGAGGRKGPRRGWFPSNYVKPIDIEPHTRTDSGNGSTINGQMSRQTSSTSFTSRQLHSTTAPSLQMSASTSAGSHRSRGSQQYPHPGGAEGRHGPRSSTSSTSHGTTLHHSQSSRLSHGHSSSHPSHPYQYEPNHSPYDTYTPLSLPASYAPALQPITQSLSLLRTSIAERHITHFQPSTALVISAIRSALEQLDCLSKDSPTLARLPHLVPDRKGVLVELSRLVACARAASGVEPPPPLPGGGAQEEGWEVEYLERAVEGVKEAVERFVLKAAGEGVEVKSPPGQEPGGGSLAEETIRVPREAAVGEVAPGQGSTAQGREEGDRMEDHFADASSGDDQPQPASQSIDKARPSHLVDSSEPAHTTHGPRKIVRSPPPSNPRMQEAFRLKTSSSDLRSVSRRGSSPPPPVPLPSAASGPLSAAMTSHGSSRSMMSSHSGHSGHGLGHRVSTGGSGSGSGSGSRHGHARSGDLSRASRTSRRSTASGTSGTSASASASASGESTPMSATFRSSDGSTSSSPVSTRYPSGSVSATVATHPHSLGGEYVHWPAAEGTLRPRRSTGGLLPPPRSTDSGQPGSLAVSEAGNTTARLGSPYMDNSTQLPGSSSSAQHGKTGTPISATSSVFSPTVSSHSHSHSYSHSHSLSQSSVNSTAGGPPDLSTPEGILASINKSEDALYSIIALFIGLIHSHSPTAHPSTHAGLIEMTKKTVDGIREVLTVVESVGRSFSEIEVEPATEAEADLIEELTSSGTSPGIRTPVRSTSTSTRHDGTDRDRLERLKEAKDGMYDLASRLVDAAEILADAPFRLAEILGEEERRLAYEAESGTDTDTDPPIDDEVDGGGGRGAIRIGNRSISPQAANALRGYEKDKEVLIRVASEGLKHASHCATVVRWCLAPEWVGTPERLHKHKDKDKDIAPFGQALLSTPRPTAQGGLAPAGTGAGLQRRSTPRPISGQLIVRPGSTSVIGGEGGPTGLIVPGLRVEGVGGDVGGEAELTKRKEVVGVRGVHTLSALHRKVASLGQGRYAPHEGSLGVPEEMPEGLDMLATRGVGEEGAEPGLEWAMEMEVEVDGEVEGEGEENLVERDEDVTMRHASLGMGYGLNAPSRPQLLHAHSSPLLSTPIPSRVSSGTTQTSLASQDRTPTPTPGRSRSSSLTSPAPPRFGHRSPSRSADLDKFTSGELAGLGLGPSPLPLTFPDREHEQRGLVRSASSLSLNEHTIVLPGQRLVGSSSGRSVSSSAATAPGQDVHRSSAYTMASFISSSASSRPHSRDQSFSRHSQHSQHRGEYDGETGSGTARSSGISAATHVVPQTPSITAGVNGEADDSPILGYLRAEASLNGHEFPRIGDLRPDSPSLDYDGRETDVDKTPIKPPPHPQRPHNLRLHTSPIPILPQPSQPVDIRFYITAHDYAPQEILFNPEGHMIGASLKVIVEKMTPHDGPVEPAFAAVFWDTWRLFTTPVGLLEVLRKRFECRLPIHLSAGNGAWGGLSEKDRAAWIEKKVMPTRLRCYNFLKAWLDGGWRWSDALPPTASKAKRSVPNDPSRSVSRASTGAARYEGVDVSGEEDGGDGDDGEDGRGVLERLWVWNESEGRDGMPAMALRLAGLIRRRMAEAGIDPPPLPQIRDEGGAHGARPESRTSRRSFNTAAAATSATGSAAEQGWYGHNRLNSVASTTGSGSTSAHGGYGGYGQYGNLYDSPQSANPYSAGGYAGHRKKESTTSVSSSSTGGAGGKGLRRSASFDKLRLANLPLSSASLSLPLPLALPLTPGSPLTPTSAITPTSAVPPPTPIISKSLHALLQKTAVHAHQPQPTGTGQPALPPPPAPPLPLSSPPLSAHSASAPPSLPLPLPPAASLANIPITEFDPLELARQMTLLESSLFRALDPVDLLLSSKRGAAPACHAAQSGNGGRADQLKNLSTLSNQITGFVADGVLNEGDTKKRAGLLKFWIKVADKCLALQNFSSLFAILAALNGSTILRLKKTWDALSQKYRTTMERLNVVIEHTRNHSVYRARLRDAIGAVLPYLGLILTDITFTSDGNPDQRPSALQPGLMLVNIDKYVKLARVAADFRRYQEAYNFHEVEAVQVYLRRALAERGSGSLDALYRKSLMLEPRKGTEKFSSGIDRPSWLGGGKV